MVGLSISSNSHKLVFYADVTHRNQCNIIHHALTYRWSLWSPVASVRTWTHLLTYKIDNITIIFIPPLNYLVGVFTPPPVAPLCFYALISLSISYRKRWLHLWDFFFCCCCENKSKRWKQFNGRTDRRTDFCGEKKEASL